MKEPNRSRKSLWEPVSFSRCIFPSGEGVYRWLKNTTDAVHCVHHILRVLIKGVYTIAILFYQLFFCGASRYSQSQSNYGCPIIFRQLEWFIIL